MILCGNRRMKSQLAEDRNGACAASFRHDNQWPCGQSDVIEHRVRHGQEQHGYCSDTEEGQPPAPDLKPTEPR
jgi:hypothetical protein